MSKKRKNRQKKKQQEQTEQQKTNNSLHVIKEVFSYAIIIIIALLLSTHLNVVVSGSMEPSFYRGDIVVTENVETFYGAHEFDPYTDIEIGDVVVYDATWYSNPVIHRVIDIEQINGSTYYIIKGDNNEVADPEPVEPSQIRSKVVTIGNHLLIIPKIGYITLMVRGL